MNLDRHHIRNAIRQRLNPLALLLVASWCVKLHPSIAYLERKADGRVVRMAQFGLELLPDGEVMRSRPRNRRLCIKDVTERPDNIHSCNNANDQAISHDWESPDVPGLHQRHHVAQRSRFHRCSYVRRHDVGHAAAMGLNEDIGVTPKLEKGWRATRVWLGIDFCPSQEVTNRDHAGQVTQSPKNWQSADLMGEHEVHRLVHQAFRF